MQEKKRTLLACRLRHSAIWLVVPALCAGGCAQQHVALYERIQEVMRNEASLANPFTDTELRLHVSAPAARKLGSSFTWYGFHDGDGAGGQKGSAWKFRLLFDEPGTWVVRAGFYVPGTSKANGPGRTFTYEVSTRTAPGEHGHVRVDPQNRLRLRCDDGTPWVPFNMHSSGLLGRDHTVARQWIDEMAQRGVDALAVRFHTESYGSDPGHYYFLLSDGTSGSTWPAGEADAFDYTRFDLGTWRYSEETMDYAESKGVRFSIWFGVNGMNRQYKSYGPLDNPDDATLGPKQKLFIRYFLARWAPYTLWWHWSVDSEYEENGKGALRRLRAFAAELQAQNPWKTTLTTHVLHDWTPGDSPELDLATIQRRVINTDDGATDCRSFITDNLKHGRPVYNAEGVWRLANGARSRVATWAHLMAGGFSSLAHMGSRRGDAHSGSWEVTWDRLNPRCKEDAVEIGKMSRFFNRTPGIDISRCVPHNELVRVEGGNLVLCLADPGRSYYVWADRGGTVRLNLANAAGRYAVRRYLCAELGEPTVLPGITGGREIELGATPTTGFGNDYLFVIERTDDVVKTAEAELVRRLAGLVCADLPELARFRDCIRRGDRGTARAYDEAADALVAFFNDRWKPNEPPAAPTERMRRTAADAMEHRFQYGALSHQFGNRIDWDHSLDYEWRVWLNRLSFASAMAKVARYDQDERVAAELQNLVRSWIEDCPLPPRQGERYTSWQKWPGGDGINWRSLDASIRVRHLRAIYSLMAGSKVVSRETRLQILYSIWQHIDYLKDDDWDGGNWLSLMVDAVSTAGLEWTVFRDAPRWRDAAQKCLERNVLRDVYPDGKEIEDSTGYVQFALNHLIQSYLRLKNGGATFSADVEERLRRSVDFSAWVVFPDGHMPMIGDSDADIAQVPLRFWRTLDRPDVGFVVTGGKDGTMPMQTSRAWPDGGWFVMRSPWASRPLDQDLHMVFKASPGGGHGHLDQLSLTAYAFGKPLLIDPGRLNYRKDGARDFACTAAHNTVIVDDTSQRRGPAHVAKWVTNDVYDFVDASHSLYKGVVHRRRVLFVKDAFWLVCDSLTSSGEHSYSLPWHFPEGMQVRQEEGRVIASHPGGPGIAVIPLENELQGEPFEYEIAYTWDRRTPARGLRWDLRGKDLQFVTLLVPFEKPEPIQVQSAVGESTRGGMSYSVRIGGREWSVAIRADDVIECKASSAGGPAR